MNITVLSIILSSTVISGIISSFISIMINKRNEYIENVTKERKEWRNEIRIISKQIIECDTNKELLKITEQIKLRINSNGITTNHILDDSYIWEYISYIKNNKVKINKAKSSMISLISCLLKYDWERSKEEIIGNKQIKYIAFSHVISFVFFTIRFFVYKGLSLESGTIYFEYCTLFMISGYIYIALLGNINYWKSIRGLILNTIVFIGVPVIYLILFSWFVYSAIYPNDWKLLVADWLIITLPITSLFYSYVIKTMKYRNDVGRLLLSVMKIIGKDEIPTRFLCFVKKNARDLTKYKVNKGSNLI